MSKQSFENKVPSHTKIPSKVNLDAEKEHVEDKKEEVDEKTTPQYFINESKRLIKLVTSHNCFELQQAIYKLICFSKYVPFFYLNASKPPF